MGLPIKRSNNGSTPPTLAWVKSNCDVNANGCWLWLGSLDKCGYARVNRRTGFIRAHRLALHLSGEAVISGLVVDHACGNRSCCNPEHLRQVTTGENTRTGAATMHHSKCLRCGCERFYKRRYGKACVDCHKKREASQHRTEAKRAYEKARAQTEKRKEQHRRACRAYNARKRAQAAP